MEFRRLAALLGLACAGGCEGATTRDIEPIAREDFAGAYAAAYCSYVFRCCDGMALPDVATCLSFVTPAIREEYPSDAAIHYDPGTAGACVYQLHGACESAMSRQACSEVFTGTVPKGGSCSLGVECAEEPPSVLDCANGTCVDQRGALGDTCGATCTKQPDVHLCVGTSSSLNGRCYTNDGLYCRELDGTCAPLIAEGEPCTEESSCGYEYDAYCNGVCVAVPKMGEACPTLGARCERGAYCDGESCKPKAPNGAPCANSWMCWSHACHDGRCVVDALSCF